MKKKFLLSVLICILIPIFLISGCSTKEAPDAGEQIITNEESKGENGSAISPSPTGTSDVAPNDDTIQPQPSAEKVPFDLSALSNESHGWGFVKKKGEKPDIDAGTVDLFRTYDTYFVSTPIEGEKTLFLTFDEGYENGYTAKILDVLKEYKVPAAFFVTGPYLKEESELVKRMVEEGHIVGNHTIHHPSMPTVFDNEVLAKEMLDLDRQFYEMTGQNMKYMRPPRGEYSERTLALSANLGYKTVLWSFAYKDWETDQQKGAQYAYDSVTPYLHDGAILLLHAVSSDNAEALPRIIQYARDNGYTFRSLDEMK